MPCSKIGEIYLDVGILETDYQCVDCDDILTECLVCHKESACDLCSRFYTPADIYDANKNLNNVCMYKESFCGLHGQAPLCLNPSQADNCQLS